MSTRRIAMWSGPRNISTAMMRAFENREDCEVIDEPLYAHYLAETGAAHPGRETVIAAGETDWRRVVERLVGDAPGGHSLWYQKHMCHHLLPGMGTGWIARLENVFLIRDPAEVVASYLRTRDTCSPAEIGIPQQRALFEQLSAGPSGAPVVIDAGCFLADPRAQLQALCARLGIGFSERMLRWPPGPRESDGVWAPHWYHQVWASTGFAAPQRPSVELDASARQIVEACRPDYETLFAHRLLG
ncbi:hypothetical protein [Pseudomarimonas salicorniae]|uniref:Sulfotransferase family protein n=1 Tax=Pseudomarimonas salicorniae TaxID=2933270 RepID=A0ABT0GD14_9GAMM|nr:hypothetical protein [Lysobacter sp. CAU 1642]MCK7592434.1 hypothetical protein [Lysobacter sp. CAU 1642]